MPDTMHDQIIAALDQAADKRLTRSLLWVQIPRLNGHPSDEYWAAEQKLVDEGRIERRRGRNGGIQLLPPVAGHFDAEPLEPEAVEVAEQDREINHYEPALDQILANWMEQPGFTHVFGAVTGLQGRRHTGGRWSRPDIVLCTVSEWLFSSRPEGDVRTIEVKRFEATDVLAVYEALSHKARSHYAYLLIVGFPSSLTPDQQADFDNLLAVAGKNGVGVITAQNSSDWRTWEFQLDPTRSDADHQAIHQLLLDQVPPDVRDKFRKAIRSIVVNIQI